MDVNKIQFSHKCGICILIFGLLMWHCSVTTSRLKEWYLQIQDFTHSSVLPQIHNLVSQWVLDETSFSQHIVDESDKETNIKTEILRKLQRKKKEAERKNQGMERSIWTRLQQEEGLTEPTQMKHINFWREMKAKWKEWGGRRGR